VRLGALVRGAEPLLRRALGDEIALQVEVADDVTVDADPGQLEQVLLNLAVNGRDAMLTPRHGHPGTGGTLTITVGAAAPPAGGAGPRWARLQVRDTGHGMDAETCAHVFEPFFTTKEVGAGTGLGLASAHGIVSQAGGVIQVTSAPGAGTTFTVLLPPYDTSVSADENEARSRAGGAATAAWPGRGTALLVEDEAAVRTSVRRLLERAGYTVREAEHGEAALAVWAAHREEIVVVVTDVRMPVLGGRALADRLQGDAPRLPVVFLSGYSDEGPAITRGAHEAFVPKPFPPGLLLAALARVLPAASGGGAAR
jgi:CheY-like chemotaxis protein